MNMLDPLRRRLFITNTVVFGCLMLVFVLVVYLVGTHLLDSNIRRQLTVMADSVIASVDVDDKTNPDTALPDLIVSGFADQSAQSLRYMRLQWFSPEGKLLAEKGTLAVNTPFAGVYSLVTQRYPSAIILTKPAIRHNRVIGYARIIHPLTQLHNEKRDLLLSLLAGSFIVIVCGIPGVYFVVRQSIDRLETKFLLLEQFSADAAHELRSPVTAIKTNSTVALRHPEGMRESDREKFTCIFQTTEQMEKMIDSLLLLTQADSIQGTCNDVADLHRVLRDITEVVRPLAESKGISLTSLSSEPALVSAREADVAQVLANIFDNAIKYTPSGGTIEAVIQGSTDHFKISISDTGIGIAPGDEEKIFGRFWRADKARTGGEAGAGLGLSIAQRLVANSGGSLRVNSAPGKGTTLTVILPAHNRK